MMNLQPLRADYIISRLISNLSSTNPFSGLHFSGVLNFAFLILLVFIILIARRIFLSRKSLNDQSVLLEFTPPAFTAKTAYSTQQLFSVIRNLGKRKTFLDKLLDKKTLLSFEIVSTLNQGIRYLIRTTPVETNNVK